MKNIHAYLDPLKFTLLIKEMERERSPQAKELLSLIDTLYDEKTRHKGLIGNSIILMRPHQICLRRKAR